MPSQPAWFHKLNDILEELRASETQYLDRQAVQMLFGVQERRARQIMAGLPGLQVGNAFAIEREALIIRLENTRSEKGFQWEIARRARLVEGLDRARRQIAARRVRIPATTDLGVRSVKDLGASIKLRPSELRIEFHSAEDLAARLFELSQAMANDWHGFAQEVEKVTRS